MVKKSDKQYYTYFFLIICSFFFQVFLINSQKTYLKKLQTERINHQNIVDLFSSFLYKLKR